MKNIIFWKKFVKWRLNYTNNYYFLLFLSVLTGFGTGLAAVLLKNLVHSIQKLVSNWSLFENHNYLYFLFPIIGISIVVLFIKYILRQEVGDGVPKVLYAISRNNAFIKAHNLFSSIISSALTVGFGGSVGLEGPTVATGAAVGSNIGRVFKVAYRQKIILLGAASAGAMAAIFKAPIAGVVFALEVIMIDLTTQSIIPILLAAASGSITSFLLMGTNVLYSFTLKANFMLDQIPYFIVLGIITGFIAVYFTQVYTKISTIFSKIKGVYKKLLIGGGLLGVVIFIFPALYGEGYETINSALRGDYSYLFESNIFNFNQESFLMLFILFLAMVLLKIIAASFTFGAGGIGGIFAPTLFTGVNTGLFLAVIFNHFGYDISPSNSALVGMAGLIAGVLQAPLTGIFLIGEITHGYGLLFPLMLTSTISFITVRIFQKNNIYTIQLARRKQLLTHHADKNTLTLIKMDSLIEDDFMPVKANDNLGELIKTVAESSRNLFPVVDSDLTLLGIVDLNRIRKIMFKNELHEKIKIREIMYVPEIVIEYEHEDPESIAEKLQKSGVFNIVVTHEGKYKGFISRANFFSHYRSLLKDFSAD
ncbi:MAG: chloride channel protein [Bacteroidales bacterium]|nr:chloride channel protein [Bacteroidales bacterium]